jgi:lysophospholipase L1-like esterase
VTPLSRRYFSNGKVRDTLANEGKSTIAAAEAGKFLWIDLHAESMRYLNAIGQQAAQQLNPVSADTTHLTPKATVLFGRMVADLIAAKVPSLRQSFVADPKLSSAIKDGKPTK